MVAAVPALSPPSPRPLTTLFSPQKVTTQIVSVLDLSGFRAAKIKPVVLQYIRDITAIDKVRSLAVTPPHSPPPQVCFPEMLGKMFIINCPKMFLAMWSTFKMFMASSLLRAAAVARRP